MKESRAMCASSDNLELPDPGLAWDKKRYIYEIFLTLPVSDRLVFGSIEVIEPEAGGSLLNIAERPKTEALDVPLFEDCVIEIRLRQDIKWCWNENMAVGRGDEKIDYYFDLLCFDETTREWVKPTKGERYIRVQFSAKHRGGTILVKDPINLNVLLEYPNDKVLPITIDPDIQNPKV